MTKRIMISPGFATDRGFVFQYWQRGDQKLLRLTDFLRGGTDMWFRVDSQRDIDNVVDEILASNPHLGKTQAGRPILEDCA